MRQRILQLWENPKSRYLVVGGSVYVLELVVIVVAQVAGASNVLAVALSFWIGLMVSFGLQKVITFRDKRYHHKIVGLQLLAVTLLVIWNFAFTVGVTAMLSGTIPAWLCRTLALATTTIWNFYLYKTRIFSNGDLLVKS